MSLIKQHTTCLLTFLLTISTICASNTRDILVHMPNLMLLEKKDFNAPITEDTIKQKLIALDLQPKQDHFKYITYQDNYKETLRLKLSAEYFELQYVMLESSDSTKSYGTSNEWYDKQRPTYIDPQKALVDFNHCQSNKVNLEKFGLNVDNTIEDFYNHVQIKINWDPNHYTITTFRTFPPDLDRFSIEVLDDKKEQFLTFTKRAKPIDIFKNSPKKKDSNQDNKKDSDKDSSSMFICGVILVIGITGIVLYATSGKKDSSMKKEEGKNPQHS